MVNRRIPDGASYHLYKLDNYLKHLEWIELYHLPYIVKFFPAFKNSGVYAEFCKATKKINKLSNVMATQVQDYREGCDE